MKRLSQEIVDFFKKQNFTVVTTIDKDGMPHNSCKGLVKINHNGTLYLLDLYRARTYDNLKRNPHMSITAVDEHGFSGYCLKGKAKIAKTAQLKSGIIKAWEKRINSRITQRIIKNVQGQEGRPGQPEALMPKPEYMIVMKTEKIIDLTPGHIKQNRIRRIK